MPALHHRTVAVIGGGPAGLLAAEVISQAGPQVTVFDRMPTVGRKFLMAGRGGLNLTHSEPIEAFIARYGAAADRFRPLLDAFTPDNARAWCEGLGQETFVGSSGRVFPKSMKASPLLRAWLRRLGDRGVGFSVRHRWIGWRGNELAFSTSQGEVRAAADAVVLAMGGASWPSLGTDGGWAPLLREAGITVAPLRPANCGLRVTWSDHFRQRFEGQPINRIGLTYDGTSVRGELMLTAEGIEGGAVYAVSTAVRECLAARGSAQISIDLRPDLEESALLAVLARSRGKQSISQFLRKSAKLSPAAIGLLQEHAHARGLTLGALQPAVLAPLINAVRLDIVGTAAITKAISTAGGIAWNELDEHLMLTARPGTFAAGEMLDWEAPTGGYLLQGCLATGAAAGKGVVQWLARG